MIVDAHLHCSGNITGIILVALFISFTLSKRFCRLFDLTSTAIQFYLTS